MFPLRALFPLRRWVAVVPVAGLALALGCQGPDEFFRYSDANMSGAAGTSATGVAGTTGNGGSTAGTGGGPTGAGGAAGSITTGTGNTTGTGGGIGTGSGGSGTGTGGTASPAGAAGSGAGGRGGSTSGVGGAAGSASGGASGTVGAAGTIGTAGSTGAAGSRAGASGTLGTGGSATGAGGRGGATGAGGSAAGTTGTGGGTDGGAATARIEVQALCQSTNGMQDIRVTFRILNPDSVTKQLSDIKVRYYFTPTAQLAPTVVFDYLQKFQSSMLTTTATTSYVEVGFVTGSGTLAAFDNVTGTDQIQLHLQNTTTPTWNTSQDDDYSYKSCTGVTNTSAYADRTTMPGYYQGQLAWGSEPSQ